VFRSSDSASAIEDKSVTIIGPEARIDGDVAFSGYLRVQGQIRGDVTCKSTSGGTTVVHASGSVAGTIESPRVVVLGRVQGFVRAADSIEIQRGASLVGDASYKRIVIRAGGVMEGLLSPVAPSAGDQDGQQGRQPVAASTEMDTLDRLLADGADARKRYWTGRKIGAVGALVGAVVVLIWIGSTMPPIEPPPATPALDPPVAPPAIARDKPRVITPPATVENTAPPPLNSAGNGVLAEAPAPPATPNPPIVNPDKVIRVQGMDADKPADAFFVETRDNAVIVKKGRYSPSDEMRIELPRRSKKRIAIAQDDIVRVAQGRNALLFYQGRKLSGGMIDSGAWISFVPAVDQAGE
jgi:cytoskeletal protein CcmA (bactofilin family)